MTQMWKEIQEQPIILSRCLKSNSDILREIVKNIKKRDIQSVYIAARGTSDHAAVYGKYILELSTGIPVALAASSVLTMYQKSMKLSHSLVIGISQSGKAADVLEVIREANRQGAVTVSITNFIDSPLAMESSFHLWCDAGLEKSVAATKTFTAQMLLLASLTAEWASDTQLKTDLSQLPEKISQTLEIYDTIKEKAQRYCFMNECFILARGINYSIALEAALKIQETTYVRAKAFATSDFQHGPIAMVERDIPVFLFAPNGPSLQDMTEMIEKLKEKQLELIVISNNKALLEQATSALAIPQTENDMISPFINVVVAQMFACELAQAKGLNPDCPRGLNKVTITR